MSEVRRRRDGGEGAAEEGDSMIPMTTIPNDNPGFDELDPDPDPDSDEDVVQDPSDISMHMTAQNWVHRLPSRQYSLESYSGLYEELDTEETGHSKVVGQAVRAQSWKKKSRRIHGTVRIKAQEQVDIEEIVDTLDGNDDSTQKEIKGMTTTLSNKRQIRDRYKERHAKQASLTDKMAESSTSSVIVPRRRLYSQAVPSVMELVRRGWKYMEHYENELVHTNQYAMNSLRTVYYTVELWRSELKRIEGQFGTGVTSYFEFLRKLLLLNIPVFVLTLSFVVIPQVLYRWRQQEPPGYSQSQNFSGWEFLTGSDWFSDTELYYGYYHNGIIRAVGGVQYDMRYAYILTCAGYYLLTMIILAISLSRSYKTNYIQTSGEYNFYYISKVFCGWDFSITDPTSAQLKHKSLFQEMQEYLAAFQEEHDTATMSQKCGRFVLRLIINIFIVGLLLGSGYLVHWIADKEKLKTDIKVLDDLAMALTISAINLILPLVFSMLAVRGERYKNPRVELILTMIRTITLNLVTLGMLLYFWYDFALKQSCVSPVNNGTDSDNVTMSYDNVTLVETTAATTSTASAGTANVTLTPSEGTTEGTASPVSQCETCWETYMGQQIYRLVIMDFIFLLFVTFVAEFLRRLVCMCCYKIRNKSSDPSNESGSVQPSCHSQASYKTEFNIGRNTLYLMYSQILIWLGTFYSPLMSVIMILKLFIIFYVKQVSVLQNCCPPSRPWRAGQTATVILGLLFLAFVCCFVAVAYGVIMLPPAMGCGPYRQYEASYTVLVNLLADWSVGKDTEWVKNLIEVVTSAAFLAGVVIVMSVAAYYTKVVSSGYAEMIQLLRHQIQLEGKDKAFLLKLLQEASKKVAKKAVKKSPWNRHHSDEPSAPGPKGFSGAVNRANKLGKAAINGDAVIETYNQTYVDKTAERDENMPVADKIPEEQFEMTKEVPRAASDGERPGRSQSHQRELTNPAYRDESPTRRPDLPYPVQPYSHP